MTYVPNSPAWADETGIGDGTIVTAARMNYIEAGIVAAGGMQAVPLTIAGGVSYGVSANTQVLWAHDIDVSGEIAVDGVFCEVN